MLVLLYEVRQYNQFIPFCKVSKNLRNLARNAKISYAKFNLPILSNREGFFVGYGYDRWEYNGTILISIRTIDEDIDFLKKYGLKIEKSKNVRVNIPYYGLQLKKISPTKTFIKLIMNSDPKLRLIPSTIINFFIRKFGDVVFNKMTALAKNIKGTDWEKQINKNPVFY